MMKKVTTALLAATIFLGSGMFVGARPAQADTSSIAAAAAAIIGLLGFDGGGRPYYISNGQPYYVSDDVANYYFQTRYRSWFNSHRNDWFNNRGRFDDDWDRDHGFRDRDDRNRGDRDDHHRGDRDDHHRGDRDDQGRHGH